MNLAKILIGLLALFIAWIFLFKTGLIYKFNTWVKNVVFSDKLVLFSRKRMAILLAVLGGVALFSGIEGIVKDQTLKPKIAAALLERAKEDYQKKEYKQAIERAKTLIRSESNHLEAWILLAESWWTLKDKKQALKAYETVIRIKPTLIINDYPIMRMIQQEAAKKK